MTHLILQEDLVSCDKCIEFQSFRLRVDPFIFTYLWGETKVSLNTCYQKERANNCYFSVAVSQTLQPSPNPCCSKVPFDELEVPKKQFVLVHTWFDCPCTGNKIRLTCCCDFNEHVTPLQTPLASQHLCVPLSEQSQTLLLCVFHSRSVLAPDSERSQCSCTHSKRQNKAENSLQQGVAPTHSSPAACSAASTIHEPLQLTVSHTSHTSCCFAPSASPWALTLCSLITHHVPAHEVSNVNHHVYLGCPHFKLPLPGGEGGQGHDHQERAIQLVLMEQVGQEWYCLNGLAQSHFISQDHAVAPEKEKNKQKNAVWVHVSAAADWLCSTWTAIHDKDREGQCKNSYLNTSKWIPETARLNMAQ